MCRPATRAARRTTGGSCGDGTAGRRWRARGRSRAGSSDDSASPDRGVLVRRLPPGLEVLEVAGEVGSAVLGIADHRLEPLDLVLQRGDLAVDTGHGVGEDLAPLLRVVRRAEP